MVDLVFVNEHTLRAFESLIRRDSTGNARGKREQMGKSFDGLYCVVEAAVLVSEQVNGQGTRKAIQVQAQWRVMSTMHSVSWFISCENHIALY